MNLGSNGSRIRLKLQSKLQLKLKEVSILKKSSSFTSQYWNRSRNQVTKQSRCQDLDINTDLLWFARKMNRTDATSNGIRNHHVAMALHIRQYQVLTVSIWTRIVVAYWRVGGLTGLDNQLDNRKNTLSQRFERHRSERGSKTCLIPVQNWLTRTHLLVVLYISNPAP